MKKIIALVFIASLMFSCALFQKNSTKSEKIAEIKLEEFDSKAPTLVNKQIIVSGKVDHVCRHSGKKLHIVNADNTYGLEVLSNNTFPDSLNGKNVTLIGVVVETVIDEKYCQDLESGAKTGDHHSNATTIAKFYRDSMKTAGVDHLSFYHIEFVSFK